MSGTERDRFYIYSGGGEPFLVCGECLQENERDTSLYDELPPLPDCAFEQGATRCCMACERDAKEIRSVQPGITQEGDR